MIEQINYKQFEELVKNILKDNPSLDVIAMTDSFFDKMCKDIGKFGFKDFRRILGIPICCLPDNELFEFSPNKGKFKVDYKFIGIKRKWQ